MIRVSKVRYNACVAVSLLGCGNSFSNGTSQGNTTETAGSAGVLATSAGNSAIPDKMVAATAGAHSLSVAGQAGAAATVGVATGGAPNLATPSVVSGAPNIASPGATSGATNIAPPNWAGSAPTTPTSVAASGAGNSPTVGLGGAVGVGGAIAAGGGRASTAANGSGAQSTGIAVVDRLGVAAMACGDQSSRTVPVGWAQAFDASGCSIEAPPSFQVSGNGTGFVAFTQGEYSAIVGAGVPSLGIPQPSTCDAAGVAEYFRAAFESWGCQGAKIVWKQTGSIIVVTDVTPVQQSVFTCDANTAGHPSMGYLFTTGTPSFAGCSMTVRAYGMPQTAIEQATCTLSQIINSVQCPTAGGGSSCDDSECRNECVGQGNQSGACTSDGNCFCTN